MIFTKTELSGVYVIDLERIEDERGFFARTWCRHEFEEHGLETNIAQCNTSFNKRKGTLRGMHFQKPPHEEVKLIRCIKGALYDVIIDLRRDSSSFRSWIGFELNEDNHRMLYVPRGFAHGFQTLANDTEAFYMVSEFYTPGAEGGVPWNDPAFDIEWPIDEPTEISDKDQSWANFEI